MHSLPNIQVKGVFLQDEFTAEEISLLSRYCTNTNKDIFVLRNLPEVVMGALFSRYSRSPKSLRRLLLDEFIHDPEMSFKDIVGEAGSKAEDSMVATQKAEEFYDRVLVGYGDDSVAELGGAHVACENVSMIATKILEDSRIGLSPLEKSTRYVYFNDKVAGKYRYHREKRVMESEFAELYEKTCDSLFNCYSEMMDPLTKFIIEGFPQDSGTSERAYKSAVRAKVCDILRNLLPAGTTTNMGMYGNGRAFEYLLTKMYSKDLEESKSIAWEMQGELEKVIPSFVKRANDKYGKETQEYLGRTVREMQSVSQQLLTEEPESKEEVVLIDCDENAEEKILSSILYPHVHLSERQLREKVRTLSAGERKKIIDSYLASRKNRRHKPGRALENAFYKFDILANYGIYRDLQRHRALTQERQSLSVIHGYDTPKELEESGLVDKYCNAMGQAAISFKEMEKEMPLEAQYVVPMGYRFRWYNTLNLREAFHLIELRSSRQGHPDYRRVVQKMFYEIKKVHPQFAEHMKFVDLNEYALERLDAEKRLDRKMEEMKGRYPKPA